MENYTTLSEAIDGLKRQGYTQDFNLACDALHCASLDLKLHPEDFTIDKFFRFEGMSDPDDNSILFAISSKDGIRGTLVDAYGMYAETLTAQTIHKLAIAQGSMM
jgi:hypothetical protein